MWLPTEYALLYPVATLCLCLDSEKISTAAVILMVHNHHQSFQKKTPKVVNYFCLPTKKKKHTCTEIQAALILFLSSPILSSGVLLKSLENKRQTWCSPPAQCLQAALRQCRNTRAIRYCLPFGLGDIEYISRLNHIRNTGEWQGPIVFATTMVTEIRG